VKLDFSLARHYLIGMLLRKTILFIGNREDDRELFENAVAAAGKQYQFLALENEPYTITRMKKSQPFWFHAIILDLSTPTIWGIPFLRELASIEHQKHVPLIAYTDICSRSYISTLQEAGASHCIQKAKGVDALVAIFNGLERRESHLFTYHLPLQDMRKQNIMQMA
jgi:DNA-binding response OmpR family regulator